MVNKNLSDGVGKKIVEALKKQSEIEITPISNEDELVENTFEQDSFDTMLQDESESLAFEDMVQEEQNDFSLEDLSQASELNSGDLGEAPEQFDNIIEETPFVQSAQASSFTGYQQPSVAIADNFASELDNFEIPNNIAVLKKLIGQLPSGVTRHTGAQIIRQTMEALGISMKSVLQEAQQVQEGLNNSARECQSTIQEYKKQIIALEKQSQSHQRQYAALNELISLFIQTGR